jgi:DNA-binding transcriptional LysR family regulator
MTELRRAWFPAVVLAATVVELVAAVAVPGVDQFDGKGWPVRLVAYPALMLVAPAAWYLTRGRRAVDPPYAAFGLIMLPFLSDTTANWLDLFRRVGWWDDFSHAAHWALLGAGVGLLLGPSVRPRWVLVPLVGGIGAILALGWELGEYALFIRDGKEAGGAYRDTLGDETLGTSGALLAGLVVAWWSARRLREPSSVEGSTVAGPDVPSVP